MKVKKLAHMIALIGVVAPASGPVLAQTGESGMQRVEITGSSIKNDRDEALGLLRQLALAKGLRT